MDNYFYPSVSEETIAAWLDGMLSAEDESLFLEECTNNADIQELLDANDQVDESFEEMIENGYELPDEFRSDFDIPKIYSGSADGDEYVYDEVVPYDYNDDSDVDDEEISYHETSEIDDDCEQNDFDIL